MSITDPKTAYSSLSYSQNDLKLANRQAQIKAVQGELNGTYGRRLSDPKEIQEHQKIFQKIVA